MANYQSRYTGPEIDERLRKAGEAVLTEAQSLDAGKQAQARENIGAASSAALEGKVDKVAGKGLSTNDYTNQDKQVVDAVPGDIAGIRGALDTLGGVVATKYTKPSTGIPASDIAAGVIPDVSQFITKTVNDLTNYYLKSETYTKDEVAALIGAIQQFHYEIVATLPATGEGNVLYLVGPTGSGSDRYEEYVYANNQFTKIGDTSIDLSGYVTTTALNTALAAYTTSSDLATLLAAKQDTIADLADIRSGAAAGATAYQKPQGGIPATDLADKYAGSPSAGGPAFKALGIPYGAVDADSTATDIKATVDNFPATLVAGVCAYIRNDIVSSASGFTLNINGTGALPVYQTLADESRATTVFSAAVTYLFIYNPTRVEGGCWDIYYGYNANDNTIGYILRTNYMSMPVTSACYRYRLLFTSANGQSFVPANASTSTNATAARTTTQTPIDPFGSIRYYNYTSAVSSGARPGVTYLCEQYQVTLGYSFNRTGAALVLTAWDPVYIKCAPQSDGSAIIDADTPYVQALPSTEDGKIYIFLGVATSATQVEVVFHHPVYYYKDGAIRQWTNAAAASITVDQTYDGTSTNAQSGVAMAGALAGKQDTIDAQHKLDYGLLSNTPTIPAAQVNSDWNAGSGVAQILNKPNLATVATSGSYDDLSNKPVVDATPTANSNNLVKSGGVFDAIEDVMEAVDGSNVETVTVLPAASASTVGKIYYVGPDNDGEYARYRGIESSGSYSFLSLGSTAMDLTDYATKTEVSQLEAKVTPISASLVDNSAVSQYYIAPGMATVAIRRNSSDIVSFNYTSINTKSVYLKKGETIRFYLSSILRQGSSYDYFIWFAKADRFTEAAGNNVSIIDGLSWATWHQNETHDFEYTATQDCYFYITSDKNGTLTANKVTYDGGFGKEIDFLNLTDAEEQEVTTSPSGPGKIDVDGTIASSSANSLHHILLKGITRVYTRTAGSTGDTLAWATYDGAGNVKRLGPAVRKLFPSYMNDPAYLYEYEIDIQDGEELLVVAVGTGLENYFKLVLYGNEQIRERIDQHQNDIVFGGNITDNENIYMWAGRLLNSVQLRKGITDNVIFDLSAQGGAYGNPNDCTFSYDANNFYFAGTFANGGGNDIIGSTDCEVRLYIVPKSGQSYSYKTIVAKDIVITDKYGDSYTIQRGGSMANLIKSGNIFYIVFSTMIDGEFLEMRCKYDPSTDEVSDYCICKLANGENLSVKGLAASGYKLFPQSARVKPVTVNMNAYCQDAFDGTYFYIGACLANQYDYPFVLKTSDFENFEVFKQLVQNDCHATFECSTAVLDGVLYTATRSLSKATQFGYLVLNSISLSTGEILSTAFVRDGISRPQLFKTTDGYIYLAHALDRTRQSGRIMRVSNLNGNLDYIADWMQVVQYAEFIANSDDNTNTYYLFVYNRIYKVEIDKYTRYSGSANMIVTYAFPLIEAIAGLIN